jgi:hypothetical protein
LTVVPVAVGLLGSRERRSRGIHTVQQLSIGRKSKHSLCGWANSVLDDREGHSCSSGGLPTFCDTVLHKALPLTLLCIKLAVDAHDQALLLFVRRIHGYCVVVRLKIFFKGLFQLDRFDAV